MQVIYILWLRQIKRYLRSKSRIFGSLGQPILFLVALGFGFGPIFKKAGGGNYIDFLLPGVIGQAILFTSLFSGMEIIWDRQFGFLKETLVAPVSRYQIMIGRTLGGATIATFQGLIIFFLGFFIGFKPHNYFMLPLLFLMMFLMAFFFASLGTAIATSLTDTQGFQLIINFLVMPMFFLSGALFPIKGLPGFLEMIFGFNPLTYGIDGLRGIATGYSHFGLEKDFIVMIIITTITTIIGATLFSKIEI